MYMQRLGCVLRQHILLCFRKLLVIVEITAVKNMNCAWNIRTTKITIVNHVRISCNVSFTANITMKGVFVAGIAWQFDLQLYVQSVPITTKVVSSDHAHSEVHSIQHYVNKFVSDLRQVRWFSPCTPVSSNIKTDRHDVAEILLRVLLIIPPLLPMKKNLLPLYLHRYKDLFSDLFANI